MEYELVYADTVEEGAALAAKLSGLADRGGLTHFGFDTEFYGVRVGRESTVARAKVHFASLAWDPGGGKIHPRGYPIPDAAVVSRDVVTRCPEFRAFLSRKDLVFLAHNAPVDAHTMKNEGIDVNVVNTLTMARWAWPGRARAQFGGGGFSLDALSTDILGEGKLEAFSDLFKERVETWEVKRLVSKWCECGEDKCRKRVAPHYKRTKTEEVRSPVYVERPVPLETVVPGHPLFDRAVRYSAQDAVLAWALYYIITKTLQRQERDAPWLELR